MAVHDFPRARSRELISTSCVLEHVKRVLTVEDQTHDRREACGKGPSVVISKIPYYSTALRLITFRSAIRARLDRISSCTPLAKKTFSFGHSDFGKARPRCSFLAIAPAAASNRGRAARPRLGCVFGPAGGDHASAGVCETGTSALQRPGRSFHKRQPTKWALAGQALSRRPSKPLFVRQSDLSRRAGSPRRTRPGRARVCRKTRASRADESKRDWLAR